MSLEWLSKKYNIEILQALNKKPMRFKDLDKKITSESIRSKRLKELIILGFVEKGIYKDGQDAYLVYQLTKKGKKISKILKNLESSLKERKD